MYVGKRTGVSNPRLRDDWEGYRRFCVSQRRGNHDPELGIQHPYYVEEPIKTQEVTQREAALNCDRVTAGEEKVWAPRRLGLQY